MVTVKLKYVFLGIMLFNSLCSLIAEIVNYYAHAWSYIPPYQSWQFDVAFAVVPAALFYVAYKIIKRGGSDNSSGYSTHE